MKGFTLVETLIAVTILTLAIAGPLYTASRSVVAAQNANAQFTASYLAQEGIEYVRLMRDNEYLSAYHADSATASTAGWTTFLTGADSSAVTQCIAPKICTLGLMQGGVLPLVPCPGNSCSASFSLLANGTPFTRTIRATTISVTDEKVVSTVLWDFHGVPYSVTVTDHLTPWQ